MAKSRESLRGVSQKQGHPQYLVKDYEKNDDKENQKDDPNDLASHLF